MITKPLGSMMQSPTRPQRRLLSIGMLALTWVVSNCGFVSAAGWTQVASQYPYNYANTMILLTDGSVMVLSGYDYRSWARLIPDSSGNYVNGTWKAASPMLGGRQLFASNVLQDGRILVLGGKYTGTYGNQLTNTNTGEIYDPIHDHWTPALTFPESTFGSGSSSTTVNGTILAGAPTSIYTYEYYNYSYLLSNGQTYNYEYWYPKVPKLRSDTNLQETWVQVPDGTTLSYDANASVTLSQGHAQTYDSAGLGIWMDAGNVPVLLTSATQNYKMGPATLLPNGKVLQIGGNGNTALYDPSTQTWVAGPTLPAGMGSDSAPGAMLPNGHFLFLADQYAGFGGTRMYDYDYTKNTITDITLTLPNQLRNQLNSYAATYCRMLVLPNGHLLLTTRYSSFVWDYAPTGAPLPSWQPSLYGVFSQGSHSYIAEGTQFNGISEGASFGNGAGMSSNYPIIKMTNGVVTTYPRMTNNYYYGGVSNPGDNSFGYCAFTVPPGLKAGTYQISVIANGIPSTNSSSIFYSPSSVTTSFANGTLTITGDNYDGAITVTYAPITKSNTIIGGTVTVTAADAYTSVNGGTTVAYNVGASRFNIAANMGNGNDTLTFNSLYSTNVNVRCGNGNNTAAFNYCSINSALTLVGGTGSNSVTFTASSIAKKNISNFH